MKNLPKEILNYFATFTETRFNFRRLINYKWSNNELTGTESIRIGEKKGKSTI